MEGHLLLRSVITRVSYIIRSSEDYDVLLLYIYIYIYISGFIMFQILVLLAEVGGRLPKHVEAGW